MKHKKLSNGVRDLCDFAAQLAKFLNALEQCDTTGGPMAGPDSFYRGGALGVYDEPTRQA